MATDRLHVITGPPGSGKSTLIKALAEAGVAVSAEVGRRIIRDQVAIGGDALPWGDESAFAELMIVEEVAAHHAALARGVPVVLDRGAPDVVGFLRASGLPVPPHIDAAAQRHRYNRRAFIAPFWAEIFVTDPERPHPMTIYEATEVVLVETYRHYGYTLVELPRAPVAERVSFVIDDLGSRGGSIAAL